MPMFILFFFSVIYDFLKGSLRVFIRQHFFMLSAAWFCLIWKDEQ